MPKLVKLRRYADYVEFMMDDTNVLTLSMTRELRSCTCTGFECAHWRAIQDHFRLEPISIIRAELISGNLEQDAITNEYTERFMSRLFYPRYQPSDITSQIYEFKARNIDWQYLNDWPTAEKSGVGIFPQLDQKELSNAWLKLIDEYFQGRANSLKENVADQHESDQDKPSDNRPSNRFSGLEL